MMAEYPALVACAEWRGRDTMFTFAAHLVFSTQAEPMEKEISETLVHENLDLGPAVRQFTSMAKRIDFGNAFDEAGILLAENGRLCDKMKEAYPGYSWKIVPLSEIFSMDGFELISKFLKPKRMWGCGERASEIAAWIQDNILEPEVFQRMICHMLKRSKSFKFGF
jgi:hypothetical protein